MNPLIDEYGRPVPLGQQVGSGGEGGVYLVPGDPSLVAKVYHQPPSGEQVEKLTALRAIGTPKLEAVCAWPRGLLRDASTRQVVGFTMPRLANEQPLQHLYNPVMRLRHYPRAGWRFQVAAARNVAAVFDDIHRAGCLVGDVNQSNAFVNNGTALVRLIDCDSFQVRANGRAYPCEVGTPHYTPPELQGWPLRGLVRTENHDRFGLAVLIYQLLFVGRHPYAGVYQGQDDPSFEELIAQYRFAQGPRAATWDMAPPPHTPTFADIPPDVGDLFRRAFERGSENGTRPTATEWMSALDRLAGQVTTCRGDAGHAYWGGASGCVWCRLARNGGPEYYYGVAGGAGTFAVDEGRLQEVLRRLAVIAPLDLPSPPAFPPMPCQPRPVSPELLQLVAALRAAREQAERELAARREAATEELKAIDEQERLQLAAFRREYEQLKSTLDDEWESVEEEFGASVRERRIYLAVLIVVTSLGAVSLLVSLLAHNSAGRLIGGIVFVVFGFWYLVYLIASRSKVGIDITKTTQAQADELLQDLRSRHERLESDTDSTTKKIRQTAVTGRQDVVDAERTLWQEVERAGEDVTRETSFRVQQLKEEATRAASRITVLTADWLKLIHQYGERFFGEREFVRVKCIEGCRSLNQYYTDEHRAIALKGESVARDRHLRLYRIADAGIPLIGMVRLQTLASQGMVSAADLSRAAVARLPGFGEGLVNALMEWREEVVSQFRPDSLAALARVDEMALIKHCR